MADLKAEEAELAARIAALHMHATYSQATLVLALAESGAVKVQRIFELMRVSADVLRQSATWLSDPVAAQGSLIAADMLNALEPTIQNMVTVPKGSGRA